MSFVSPEFLLFFVVAVTVYFATPFRLRWVFLLIASYFFYAYWNAELIILIVASTLIDYFVAQRIANTPIENVRQRKSLLAISMLANLGILFTFKYFNFFVNSSNDLFGFLGLSFAIDNINVLLPVGISFYTFQSMSYTIDVYRGDIEAEKNAGIFATYVAFFPQLVAGPIERASNMIPQFKIKHSFEYERVVGGLRLALWGFFKKVVIADRVAIYVNEVYGNPDEYTGAILIIATIFFAIQIYCDFSGYSDIAIGTARVMGFDLMLNFRQPYFSRSIREFWRRWHISLSTWFRDYVYIPLGGNRVTFLRNLANLLIVFVVSGLWHGANWTFVIWGALHGVFIVGETIWTTYIGKIERKGIAGAILSIATWFVTLIAVLVAWVFFRANNLSDALYIVSNFLNFDTLHSIYTPFEQSIINSTTEFWLAWAGVFVLFVYDFVDYKWDTLRLFNVSPIVVRWAFYYLAIGIIYLSLLFGSTTQEFIYFQF